MVVTRSSHVKIPHLDVQDEQLIKCCQHAYEIGLIMRRGARTLSNISAALIICRLYGELDSFYLEIYVSYYGSISL